MSVEVDRLSKDAEGVTNSEEVEEPDAGLRGEEQWRERVAWRNEDDEVMRDVAERGRPGLGRRFD